ncbi:MAG TPA: hypothetical protein VHY84_08235 [Bryobacteraceae bacterium]|nr:hypothetical protein [Bryobacteraceae bacterium]
MKSRGLLIWGACLATLPLASAHRLDEYLQATRISLETDRVGLEIDLTPGIAMASQVIGWIDTNRDGTVSSAEGDAYAREVLRSVLLKADGKPLHVDLVSASFPEFGAMKQGVGIIRLRATAKIPRAGLFSGRAGSHQISYINMYRSQRSVYLVNALVPRNPHIEIADQQRDRAQHAITLQYSVAADPPSAWSFALIAGLAVTGRWYLRRKRRQAPGALELKAV